MTMELGAVPGGAPGLHKAARGLTHGVTLTLHYVGFGVAVFATGFHSGHRVGDACVVYGFIGRAVLFVSVTAVRQGAAGAEQQAAD